MTVQSDKSPIVEAKGVWKVYQTGSLKVEALRGVDLSGGQQQRVTIARALVNKPAIVWGDEPTGNLDSDLSKEIVQLLRRLNREYGLTLVLVTHDQGVAQETHRIVQMRNGLVEREVAPVRIQPTA